MTPATWCLFVGGLLLLMGISSTLLKSLPVSAAAIYMVIGYATGPQGLGVLDLTIRQDAALIEVVTEIALLVALFAVGLRLQVRVFGRIWLAPILLATLGMTLTIALMTAAGVALLGSLGAAVLLAAIVAPTDPVLASDVRVKHEDDRDLLRFGLTAEGGLNDGTAFPFVLLGLGLLGAHDLGAMSLRWVGVDLLWAVGGGLALGWLCGAGFTRLIVFLRHNKQQALGMESFLALGLIAVTYGIALEASVYGFLAVFVAGLGVRDVQLSAADEPAARAGQTVTQPDEGKAAALEALDEDDGAALAAQSPAKAAGSMTSRVLSFAQELERFVELAAMLIIGSVLNTAMVTLTNLTLAAALLVIARPVAVYLTTLFTPWSRTQRRMGAWFGIRGVGSLYYLAYAATHGLPQEQTRTLADIVLLTIATSVVLHGVSATPLMKLYQERRDPAGRPGDRSR
ncbi:cation:proton antiporter [Variovorax paradoxus]|nr:cation:proton antiporter [Variovorax paradoxus]MBT2305152.1 cation:proton antiporter [Variovorax paradoxus]